MNGPVVTRRTQLLDVIKIFCEESCKATLLKGTLPAPRRNVRSTPDGGSAVQPPGLSCTAHWEALGCALCLLTTPEIVSTGPVRGRGFCPGSHRPRARTQITGVGLGLFVMRLPCCGLPPLARPLLFALRSPSVCQRTVTFVFSFCLFFFIHVFDFSPNISIKTWM